MAFQHLTPPTAGHPIAIRPDGKLDVPNDPVIPHIVGDGTGPDIWNAARPVLDAAVKKAAVTLIEVFPGKGAGGKGYVTLTGEPHPEWTAILKNLHDNWIYLLRRRIAVQGNKILMVFGDENEIAPHIDHLKKLIKETNDRASRVNQTRVEQQKRTQKIELDRLLEAEKAKKKLRKINAGLQTGTP